MKSQACIDASLIVALLVAEEHSLSALALWEKWAQEDCSIVAPLLLRYEVTSALYRKALRGLISREDASLALNRFLKLDIEWIDPPSLPERATELAHRFSRPNTYDTFYLALAEQLNCGFWTGDERLYNAVKSGLGFIRWIGNG
jgi:predicted nucleic acid-binding protein